MSMKLIGFGIGLYAGSKIMKDGFEMMQGRYNPKKHTLYPTFSLKNKDLKQLTNFNRRKRY